MRIHPAAAFVALLAASPALWGAAHQTVALQTAVLRFLIAVVLAEAAVRGISHVVATYRRVPESSDADVVHPDAVIRPL